MKLFRTALTMLLLTYALSASAHEFWMRTEPLAPKAGTSAGITLNVGEYFSGDLIGFTTTNVASIRHFAAGKVEELGDRIAPGAILPELRLAFATAGTHLIAFDSHPSQITLPADKFHAYLHDEGLDEIIRRREASGTAANPGRERYRRCVKSLIRVGGLSDTTYSVHTAQRLEILPLSDPFAKRKDDALDLQVLFDGKPLPNVLVKAWYKHDAQTLTIRARSTADGKLRFTLPYRGFWMISAVHMIAATDSSEADWDSYWGNLSFELPVSK